MKDTYFSHLHPAVNFGFFIGAIGFSVAVQHPAYLIAGAVGAFLLGLTLTGKKMVKNLLMLLPLFVVLSAINPLFNTLGEHVLFRLWGRPYTWEALCYGMSLSGTLVSMMLWFFCYNAVMTEDKFTYLFSNLAPAVALLLTMVFRLIPNLLKKIRQIMDARKCIGMGAAEDAGVGERVKDGMTILSVLSSWALEGSVVTADSMNSRGYGTARRIPFHSYCFTATDAAVTVMLAIPAAVALAYLLNGSGDATFTPAMVLAPPDMGVAAYSLFLLIPTVMNLKEELIWHILRSKI